MFLYFVSLSGHDLINTIIGKSFFMLENVFSPRELFFEMKFWMTIATTLQIFVFILAPFVASFKVSSLLFNPSRLLHGQNRNHDTRFANNKIQFGGLGYRKSLGIGLGIRMMSVALGAGIHPLRNVAIIGISIWCRILKHSIIFNFTV